MKSFFDKILYYTRTFVLIGMICMCASCSKDGGNKETQDNDAKIQAQIALANKHLSDGNATKAIDILEAVFDKHQDSADVIEMLGFAYWQDRDNSLAAFHFERAAETDASKGVCFLYAARANIADNEIEKAISDYEQYLDAFDDDYVVFGELADVFWRYNKIDRAFKIYCVIADNISLAQSLSDDTLIRMANVFWGFSDKNRCKIVLKKLKSSEINKNLAKIGLLKLSIAEKDWNNVKLYFSELKPEEHLLEINNLITARRAFAKWGSDQKRILSKIYSICDIGKLPEWKITETGDNSIIEQQNFHIDDAQPIIIPDETDETNVNSEESSENINNLY